MESAGRIPGTEYTHKLFVKSELISNAFITKRSRRLVDSMARYS